MLQWRGGARLAAGAARSSPGPELLSVTGSPRPQPTAASAGQEAVPEVTLCRFCPAPAESLCPRCAAPYCALHGGLTCDECSRPSGGLPSGAFTRGVVAVFVAAVVLALPLLLFRPRLPGERPLPASSNTSGTGPGSTARPSGTVPSLSGGAPAPTAPASGRYTIQPGDTLAAIAAQHGVSVDDLISANPGIDPQRLQIGAEIVIPPRR